MGTYYTSAELQFRGSKSDEEKLQKLLYLMDKDGDFEDFREEYQESPYVYDGLIQHALLGKLEDRGEGDSWDWCRFWPDFDLKLAPQLLAALFPKSTFTYSISWEYSVGGGETILKAEYGNAALKIWECQKEEDLKLLTDEQREAYCNAEMDPYELEEILFNAKGARNVSPSRNASYEHSFYQGDLDDKLNEAWCEEDWKYYWEDEYWD